MAVIATDNKHYTDIANAIREKNGSTDTYKPADMANAIQALQTGDADVKRWEVTLAGLAPNSNGVVLQDDWLKEHCSDANLCFQLVKTSDKENVYGNVVSNSANLVSQQYGTRLNSTSTTTPYPFYSEDNSQAGFLRLSQDGTVRYVNGNITEAEYNNITALLQAVPLAPIGYYYRLRTDLTWEQREQPSVVESDDEEPATIGDYQVALTELGVRT